MATIKHPSAKVRLPIKLLQGFLYILLQILFLPLLVFGLPIGLFKEAVNSRKYGVSFSAGQALQYRWFMHYLETRPDPLTVRFVREFPCESVFGLWATMGALILSQRLFGFKTRLSKVAEPEQSDMAATSGSRVVAFDRILEKYLDEMEQIVIPGAGFDLLALQIPEGKNLKVFELDQAKTLNLKVRTLEKAGIQQNRISWIPVEYGCESWAEKLVEAGFDKTRKTLFLWQSVSLYLDETIVRETLRQMAALCAAGSVVAQDFYSRSFSAGDYSFVANRNLALIASMGEPAKFGIDMSNDPREAVGSFLAECGLEMTEFVQFGKQVDMEPFYCITEAQRQ